MKNQNNIANAFVLFGFGMVVSFMAYNFQSAHDYKLSKEIQTCSIDSSGNLSFISAPGIVTNDGTDPISLINGDRNPLYSSAFFSPFSIATSAHWRPALMQGKIAETYLGRGVKDNKMSYRLTGKTIFKEQTTDLPIVSIIMDVRDLLSSSDGIYVPGNDWYNGTNDNLFKSWFMRKGNYSRRGEVSSRSAYVQIFDTTRSELFSGSVGLRIHGNATRSYPQKSLRISAKDEPLIDIWGAEVESFILRNGGNTWETTMIGDLLCQNLVAKTRLMRQKGESCVVLINGYYWGIHNFRDRLKVENLAIRNNCLPEDISIWEGWRLDKGHLNRGRKLEYLLNTAKANGTVDYADLENEIDLKEFAQYVLIEVFLGNGDWPNNNFYMVKTRKGKWHPVLTDLDFCLGYNGIVKPEENGFERLLNTGSACKYLFRSLLTHETFRKLLINEYQKLAKAGVFSEDHFNSEFEYLTSRIAPEIPRQISRWRKLGSKNKWSKETRAMHTFYTARLKHFEEHFQELINANRAESVEE